MDDNFKKPGDFMSSEAFAKLEEIKRNSKPEAPKPKTWEDFLPIVQTRMEQSNIDDSLPYFARMVAKIKAAALPENGAIFSGCTGCGKTVRAQFLAKFCYIRMKTAREMVFELAQKDITMGNIRDCAGLDCVETKTRNAPFDLVIDDLGSEPPDFTIYGTKMDLMSLMLEERLNRAKSVKTYITTNLGADDLRKRYGERIFSRMQENLIFLKMPKTDRRIGKAYGWN